MARDPGQSCAKDERPTDELVDLYLAAPDTDDGQQALATLHCRGSDAELAHGARLAKAATEAERVAGADILAQLGWEERTHLEDSVAILLTLLNDPSDAVVSAAAIALGHRHHPRAIQPLVELARHPSPAVRHGAVHGLMGHEDLAAVAALIELTRDPDRDVRDWATFAIAQCTDRDSPELREALFSRTEDEDPEVPLSCRILQRMNSTLRIDARQTLSEDERRDAGAIVDACLREGLSLKLDLDLLPDDGEVQAIVARSGSTLVGFCTLDSGRDMELCGAVHPDHRRRGVGRALLAAALAESRRRGRERALVICEDASLAGVALLSAAGATRAFAEHRMELAARCHAPESDHGLTVQRADPADAVDVARVIAHAMNDDELHVRRDVDAAIAGPAERVYLAREGGHAVAALRVVFGSDRAYIYGFGVLSEHRRRGIGRRFLTEVIAALQAEGHNRIALEVETDNIAAVSLYRTMGFTTITTYGYHAVTL